MTGRVAYVDGKHFSVETANGAYYSVCRGNLRNHSLLPVSGDFVELENLDEKQKTAVICQILPRLNSFKKPPCANIDTLVIVASDSEPRTDLFFIDSLTQLCILKKIKPVICANKSDTAPDNRLYETYGSLFDFFSVSAETGEGILPLTEYLQDKTALMAGNSGVGKSSLINALIPDALAKTDQLSERIGRGKQTTRKVTFFVLPQGGLLADSAGYSSLDFVLDELSDSSTDDLLFTEFIPYAAQCRWSDCRHNGDKGCAIENAVRSGLIPSSRLESYRKLKLLCAEKSKLKLGY